MQLSKVVLLLVLAGTLFYAGQAQAHTFTVHSTAYCLRGTMADGSYTRHRSVANNFLPLGAKIRLVSRSGPYNGYHIFYVRDRIGYGSQLDFWVPTCSQAYRWGRRSVRFRWNHTQ